VIRQPERLAIGRLLGWVAALATVIVAPWAAYDPINVPKLAVISAGGFMSLGFVFFNAKVLKAKELRTPLIVVGVFIVDLLAVLLFAGSNFNQEFFGANGRATGFVAYLALSGLLVAGVIAGSSKIALRLSWFLLGTGLLSVVYGLMQSFGKDPVKWVNSYSPVTGFVGNPDFQSAFVAFSAIMAIAMLFAKDNKNSIKAGLVAYVMAALYVIKETKAQQGFLVLAGSSFIIALVFINKSKAKGFTWPLGVTGILGAILVVAGSLDKGPLASLLHKASVIYRGDYWRAGWKMTTQHPLFGVGLDSYGDWYRRSRTVAATIRRGPDTVSNAAHNVLLDFSSNGGFPLLAIYLVLMALVIRAAWRYIRRTPTFDPLFTGLFAVWIAYQAQSVISLNQLGLAVWGWIISGLIIGWEINADLSDSDTQSGRHFKKNKSAVIQASLKVQPITTVALFVGLIVGLLVGLPPLIGTASFKSALESGDPAKIIKAALQYPQDPTRMVQASIIFHDNKLMPQALEVIQVAVVKFPNSYDAWNVLATLGNATPDQVTQAKAQMKRLDPHNPELK
jgi:O-antigen ligase